MKVKTLRKKDTLEFIIVDSNTGDIYTTDTPEILAETATMELMGKYLKLLKKETDLDNIELVEYNMIEFEPNDTVAIGADIRNKLTPSLNLIALIKIYLKETDETRKANVQRLMETEMEKSTKNIKYISNLL